MQPHMSLLKLPTEVRLQIYQHLFSGQSVRANAFHYPQDDESSGRPSLQPLSPLINILLICRQIQSEAIVVFYSVVKLEFQRHSIDEINWSILEVKAAFPAYRTSLENSHVLANTRDLARYVSYAGNDQQLIRRVGSLFPNLKHFEFDLGWDHMGYDQTNFDRAMKFTIRHKEWRHAIKDALEQRFPDGMVHAVFELQKYLSHANLRTGTLSNSEVRSSQGFKVVLHWRLAWRFIEFMGECDLDEWILRVRDPDGTSKNVYDIRQDPLFYEMF